MKIKRYKKIAALLSALSLAFTGLTGLNTGSSVSAAPVVISDVNEIIAETPQSPSAIEVAGQMDGFEGYVEGTAPKVDFDFNDMRDTEEIFEVKFLSSKTSIPVAANAASAAKYKLLVADREDDNALHYVKGLTVTSVSRSKKADANKMYTYTVKAKSTMELSFYGLSNINTDYDEYKEVDNDNRIMLAYVDEGNVKTFGDPASVADMSANTAFYLKKNLGCKPNKTKIEDGAISYGSMGASTVIRVEPSYTWQDGDTNKTETVTKIAKDGFNGRTKLREITISPEYNEIGAAAFSGCSSLKLVRIEGGSTDTIRIDETAFNNCGNVLIATQRKIIVTKDGTAQPDGTTVPNTKLIKSVDNEDNIDVKTLPAENVFSTNDYITIMPNSFAVFDKKGTMYRLKTYLASDLTDYNMELPAGWLTWDDIYESERKNITWGVYQPGTETAASPGKAVAVGKFLDNKKYSKASLKGDLGIVGFGDMKANGAFNGVGVIKATITKEETVDGVKKKIVYTIASFDVYVEPAFVSLYADPLNMKDSLKGSNKKNVTDEAYTNKWNSTYKKLTDKFTYDFTEKTGTPGEGILAEYELNICEGVSFNLPFKALNGVNKALNYETYCTYYNDGSGQETITDWQKGFTVASNGKVTALPGGAGQTGEIHVRTQDGRQSDNLAGEIVVHVTVKPFVKKLRANTTSLTFAADPDDGNIPPQEFTVSADPVSNGTVNITFAIPEGITVEYNDTSITSDSSDDEKKVAITGAEQFRASISAPAKFKDVKAADRKLTLSYRPTNAKTGANDSTLVIKLAEKDVYDNVKSIKQAGKVNKATNTIDLNVPLGTLYNLGVSVQPVTADSGLEILAYKYDATLLSPGYDYENPKDVCKGDVFIASEIGDYEVYVKSHGKGADGKPVNGLYTYNIHVYNPGSSIVWADGTYIDNINNTVTEGYTIRGGFLVKDDKLTDKTFIGGQTIAVPEPRLEGADGEIINWTSNKPEGMAVENQGGTLKLTTTMAGTYVITGTSSITKQKFSFKVLVAAGNVATTDEAKAAYAEAATVYCYGTRFGENYTVNPLVNSNKTMQVGESIQLFVDTSNNKFIDPNGGRGENSFCADKVTYSVDPANAKNVTVKNGLVKAVKATTGDATITITMKASDKSVNPAKSIDIVKTVKVKVNAKPVIKITKCPTYVNVNEDFKSKLAATASNVASNTATWYYEPDDGTHDARVELTAGISTAGIYKVYPVYDTDTVNTDASAHKIVYVYDIPAKVTVLDPKNITLADLKSNKAGQGIGCKINEYEEENGEQVLKRTKNNTLIVPIAFQKEVPAGKGKKTYELMDAGTVLGNITWTSSNANIANAETMAVGTAGSEANENANAYVEITFNKNYKGNGTLVTLTGVSDNGGKTIKIQVYVRSESTEFENVHLRTNGIKTISVKPSNTINFISDQSDKTIKICGTYEYNDEEKKLYTHIDKDDMAITDKTGTPISGFEIISADWDKMTYSSGNRPFTVNVKVKGSEAEACVNKELCIQCNEYDSMTNAAAAKYTVKKPELTMKKAGIVISNNQAISVDFTTGEATEADKDIQGSYTPQNGEKISLASIKNNFSLVYTGTEGEKFTGTIKSVEWVNPDLSYIEGDPRAFKLIVTIKKDGSTNCTSGQLKVKVGNDVIDEVISYGCRIPEPPVEP